MKPFLKQHYGDCEGPLGTPCTDKQARALEDLLRGLPRDDLHEPGHTVVEKAMAELLPGERADVSWISTEDPDRTREIVLARGMNDDHFKINPVVTLQHAYWLPPVGRSLWRKRVRDGERVGIKAKTQYPPRPDAWPNGESWPPDYVFPLVQAGLLCGKSIGFLPTKARAPTDDEIARHPDWANVKRIVEEWVLLEYACVYLPAQQHAVVEAVSKGLPDEARQALNLPETTPIPFTALSEIERAIQRRLDALDLESMTRNVVSRALDKARGRI